MALGRGSVGDLTSPRIGRAHALEDAHALVAELPGEQARGRRGQAPTPEFSCAPPRDFFDRASTAAQARSLHTPAADRTPEQASVRLDRLAPGAEPHPSFERESRARVLSGSAEPTPFSEARADGLSPRREKGPYGAVEGRSKDARQSEVVSPERAQLPGSATQVGAAGPWAAIPLPPCAPIHEHGGALRAFGPSMGGEGPGGEAMPARRLLRRAAPEPGAEVVPIRPELASAEPRGLLEARGWISAPNLRVLPRGFGVRVSH